MNLHDYSNGRTLMVAYGMGVDSTAMLVGLHARGIRPDAILFADTGSEKPTTYEYLAIINAWLVSVGFPTVTVVRRNEQIKVRAPYTTLEENCTVNETLPSLAFGYKSCSLKWKRDPQDAWTKRWEPARRAWARGEKVEKMIGYDAGPADSRRSKITDDAHYTYTYPLRTWGWARERCIAEIKAAGLPVPVKSACWFCPASKKHEVEALAVEHPELYGRALAMEAGARNGKHGLGTVKGLGRKWSWSEVRLPVVQDEPGCDGF